MERLNSLITIDSDSSSWQAAVHGITESDTTEQLNHNLLPLASDLTFCSLPVPYL